MKKILVMGLPGSGKTTLAKSLVMELESALWLNADKLRRLHNDWDFSREGRLRQAIRMRKYAEISEDEYVVADFVCPLEETRTAYSPDVTIWVDTIKLSRFADTNVVFTPPKYYDFRVDTKDAVQWAKRISSCIQ